MPGQQQGTRRVNYINLLYSLQQDCDAMSAKPSDKLWTVQEFAAVAQFAEASNKELLGSAERSLFFSSFSSL